MSLSLADQNRYNRLSLSRLPLSRTTAYLKVKIWSLFKHENLTSGNKKLWKRGEMAPKEQFLLFSTICLIYLLLKESKCIIIMVVWFIFSSILLIWYVELRTSRSISESPLDFRVTRVDCTRADSVDRDEMAHIEPAYLDLQCLIPFLQ